MVEDLIESPSKKPVTFLTTQGVVSFTQQDVQTSDDDLEFMQEFASQFANHEDPDIQKLSTFTQFCVTSLLQTRQELEDLRFTS